MKSMLWGVLAALLPVAALANGAIDVRVDLNGGTGWDDEETWIEFEAEQDAFVAVYATFSDGNFEMVFPVSAHDNHWVEGGELYAVPVWSADGVWLEDVQAVASVHWFDPSECWLAFDQGYDWYAPRVLVATAYPVWSWGFSFSWSTHSHCWTEVRRIDWYAPRCDYGSRFDRSWYRTAFRERDRGWDRGWNRNWDHSREREMRTARAPSARKERRVVRGESALEIRKQKAVKPHVRNREEVRGRVRGRDDVKPHVRSREVEKPQWNRDADRSQLRSREAEKPRLRDRDATKPRVRERGVEGPRMRPRDSERPRVRRPEASRPQVRRSEAQRPQPRKPEAVKERRPKRESSSKSNSVRWTAGGGSRQKVDSAPGKKSSASRGKSGEPKRRSGR